MLLALYIHVQTTILGVADRLGGAARPHAADERGQATAEYALVLLGAAAVAALLAAWAAKTGKVGKLLDAILDKLLGNV
jgi:hypothetical protein